MRKYRVFDKLKNEMYYQDDIFPFVIITGNLILKLDPQIEERRYYIVPNQDNFTIKQFTGLKDKNGVEIYEGDILRFSDKWEWYKGLYGIKMFLANDERKAELQKQFENEPYEERIVEDIREGWLFENDEIQVYWEIIGNIHQNKDLL